MAHIMTSILAADFGILDKVKHHPERNNAASEAAKAYVIALAIAVSEASKGPQTGKVLEWPESLNTEILGAEKKLTAEGIAQLKDPYNMWALVPISDAACVTPSLKDQNRRQGLTSLNRNSISLRAMSSTPSRSVRNCRS